MKQGTEEVSKSDLFWFQAVVQSLSLIDTPKTMDVAILQRQKFRGI
jgi:hypothetical protein